jgi:hypothetical protein
MFVDLDVPVSGLYKSPRLAWRRYQVRRDISSLSQGFLASLVRARSSIRGHCCAAQSKSNVEALMLMVNLPDTMFSTLNPNSISAPLGDTPAHTLRSTGRRRSYC